MTHVVTEYFRRKLHGLGYTVEKKDITWGLGHCQGDGMAFTGSFHGGDLKSICRRLLRGYAKELYPALRAITNGASIVISSNSSHYSHYNTMNVDGDVDRTDSNDIEMSCFDSFLKAVEEDVRDTSKRLANDGYEILDAFGFQEETVRTFRTKQFELRITELPEEAEGHFGDLEDSSYQELAAGKYRIRCIRIEIFNLDEDGDTVDEIGNAYLGGVWIPNHETDRSYGGYRRQLISEAVEEARRYMGLVKKPQSKLAIAA